MSDNATIQLYRTIYIKHHHHHSCRLHATKTAYISSTTSLCLSIHLVVQPEISTSWYQYPFSLHFSLLYLRSGDVDGHVVGFVPVAANKEPASAGGQLAYSKGVMLAVIHPNEEVFHRRES